MDDDDEVAWIVFFIIILFLILFDVFCILHSYYSVSNIEVSKVLMSGV